MSPIKKTIASSRESGAVRFSRKSVIPLAALGAAALVLLSAGTFRNSLDAGAPLSPAAQRGKNVFYAKPCAACHFVTAQRKVGPGLKGVYGRMSKDGVGRLTYSRLRKFLLNPRSIKKNAQMIRVPLTNRELSDLIAYLKTL